MIGIWKDIKGYEGLYRVSDFGRVKSIYYPKIRFGREIILKQGSRPSHQSGRLKSKMVVLTREEKRKTHAVHRLVADAFIPNPGNKTEVNHIDGNPSNNNSNNLEWVTPSENVKHAYRIGLIKHKGEHGKNARLTNEEVVEIRRYVDESNGNYGRRQLAETYNVSESCIKDIISGRTWVGV